MDPKRYRFLKDLVGKAIELPEFERDLYLQENCDDAELLAEARDLLLHYQPDSAITAGAAGQLPDLTDKNIGPYQILEPLGEGGMGVVYLAAQSAPLRRKVAVKVIKLGMDTREVISRFESERQALALMDHPNIAKVYDAGATDEGRPYFAMEFIPGVPLNKYCEDHQLGLDARLKLFIQVCQGVQHAHNKGIIHRDLKPGNILVAEIEGKPVPKIIDFGVSKATSQHLAAQTLFTKMGQMIGTPEYMSPEQAGTSLEDVDTRSDVYSLGVMLYELLTGAVPLERSDIMRAGLERMALHVQNEIPKKPSTRIDTESKTKSGVVTSFGKDTGIWAKRVRGDLDWITMKALEKERERRYVSPDGLAADLERHLKNLPVEAGPPSGSYRLRKFVQRNRVVVGLVTIAFAALVGITVWQAWQSGIIKYERDKAMANERLSHARGQVTQDPTVAVAYALSSLELLDQPATREVVRQAVAMAPLRHKVPHPGLRGNNVGVDPSPDGRFFAVPWSHQEVATLAIHSIEDYSQRILKGPGPGELFNVAYSADGTYVAGLGYHDIFVWRVADGEFQYQLQGGAELGFPNIFRLTDPAKIAISRNRAGEPTQWQELDLANGTTEEIGASLGSIADQANHLAVMDPSGHWIIDYEGMRLFIQTREELGTERGIVIDAHEAIIFSVAVDAAGETAASVDNEGHIKVWNLLSSPPELTFEFKEEPGEWAVMFDPYKKRLISFWGGGSFNIHDLSEIPARRSVTLNDGSWWTHMGRFLPDGTILTTGNGTTASHWKTEFPLEWSMDLSDFPGYVMAWMSEDGNRMYLWSTEGDLVGMPLAEGGWERAQVLGRTSGWSKGIWSGMAVDEDRNLCLTFYLDSGTEMLDLATGEARKLPGFDEGHILWGTSKDGRYAGLVSFPEGDKYFVYDMDSLKTVGTVNLQSDDDQDFCFSGASDLLVMKSDHILKYNFRNSATEPDTLWKAEREFEGWFLEDGRKVLALDEDLDLTLVNLSDGRSEVVGRAPERGMSAVEYRPELGILAVGGWWDTMEVFDLNSGNRWSLPVPGEGSKFTSNLFLDPGGGRLISVHSGNILAWKLPLSPVFANPEYDELMELLRSMTNVRVVPDETKPVGFRKTTTQALEEK